MSWTPAANRLFLLPLLAVVIIAGVATAGMAGEDNDKARTSTARDPKSGSHGERTYLKPDARLGTYKAVLILPPTMDTTGSRTEKVDDFIAQLQGTISTSLEQSLRETRKFEVVTTDASVAKQKGKYLVCKSDALVHFGSTAARILVGFGAGRSKLIVVASLEEPESADVVLKYTGWGGAIMGSASQILGKMQTDAIAISKYFGTLTSQIPD